MSHVTFETAARLKEAGFPQPKPSFGQFWWFAHPETMWTRIVIVGTADFSLVEDKMRHCSISPALEDITALLPSVFTLEMREGRHSCNIDTWQNLVQTQADNFAEAAALAWLALNTP